MKGVPIRIAIGARDLANNVVEIARRDTKEKQSVSLDGLDIIFKTYLQLFRKICLIKPEHTEMNTLPMYKPGTNL
jgi:prolyl-tRNA synthetase